MRTKILILFVGSLMTSSLMTGCALRSGPTTEERKAECDRYAAQAIGTESLDEARRLAAQASDCYADLQAQRR